MEESRSYIKDYGETLDGRPRFDLQPGHNLISQRCGVCNRQEVSDVYANVMRKARTVDYCADLLGPNLKFHHGKVNSKLPGSGTEEMASRFSIPANDKWWHLNLFIVSGWCDMKNGPLRCWAVIKARYIPIGIMGYSPVLLIQKSLSNKITKLCHVLAKLGLYVWCMQACGSAPNSSSHARTLYITTYYAEDAIELSPNPCQVVLRTNWLEAWKLENYDAAHMKC